jgi:hypothetical protein
MSAYHDINLHLQQKIMEETVAPWRDQARLLTCSNIGRQDEISLETQRTLFRVLFPMQGRATRGSLSIEECRQTRAIAL